MSLHVRKQVLQLILLNTVHFIIYEISDMPLKLINSIKRWNY